MAKIGKLDEISMKMGELQASVRMIERKIDKINGSFVRVAKEQNTQKDTCFRNVTKFTQEIAQIKTENRMRYAIAGGSGGSIAVAVTTVLLKLSGII